MSLLTVNNLSVSFPHDNTRLPVLQDLSLSVQAHEIFVLLGESGCGKTTLLRTIGGFQKADNGEILFDNMPLDKPSKERMMIFQSFDQLFPWFTLRENLLYALKKTGTKKDDAETLAENALRDTGLLEFRNHYPASLSGGMKQRGAIARALAVRSKLLLMDEPFSSLDEGNRQHLYQLVQRLRQSHGTTILLVTHDIEEALLIGDRIAILDHNTHHVEHIFRKEACSAGTLRQAFLKSAPDVSSLT